MEWDFEETQKGASFSLENKARIDRDSHSRLFELVSRDNQVSGGPGSMKIIHFGAGPIWCRFQGGFDLPT